MGWISVEEKLPEKDTTVDVLVGSVKCKDYFVRRTDIVFNENELNAGRRKGFQVPLWESEIVLYWMPLPKLPTN